MQCLHGCGAHQQGHQVPLDHQGGGCRHQAGSTLHAQDLPQHYNQDKQIKTTLSNQGGQPNQKSGIEGGSVSATKTPSPEDSGARPGDWRPKRIEKLTLRN